MGHCPVPHISNTRPLDITCLTGTPEPNCGSSYQGSAQFHNPWMFELRLSRRFSLAPSQTVTDLQHHPADKAQQSHPGCNFLWQWHLHPDFWIKLVKQKWGEFQPRAAVNRISVIPIMNLKAVLWTLCFRRCYTQKLGLTNLQLITTQLIQFGFCMGGAKRTEIKGGVDVSGTGSVPEGSGIPCGNSICWLQESNGSFLLGFLYLFTGGLDQMNKFQDTARSW